MDVTEQHEGSPKLSQKTQKTGYLPHLVPVERIERRIFLIRGQKVMLDSNLAMLYQVPTKSLNLAVRRNAERFPEDFMFQLTRWESESLRFQFETSKKGRGGRRYLPYVFTEHGVAMLSSVLKSKRAVQMNILIIRAFIRLREIIATHKDLACKLQELERKQEQQGAQIGAVYNLVRKLQAPPKSRRRPGSFAVRYENTNASTFSFLVDNPANTWQLTAGVSNLSLITATSAGNVGIGTTSPSTKLHVAGDVTVDGVISAYYSDLAEWVQADRPLPDGTVVVLDKRRINGVIASSRPYDLSVAGVVSATPGVLLGQAGKDKLKVATTGRVKVKVDAGNAPIEIGDLLVSSGREGMAMRSDPVEVANIRMHRPGTLIGKALEPLAGGEGEILVLLSLQ